MSGPGVLERPDLGSDVEVKPSREWIVTVYNNEYNTYEEVISILMLATGCPEDEAFIETWEIDHLGKSVVHCAKEDECRKAAEIISTIGIRVEVSKDGS